MSFSQIMGSIGVTILLLAYLLNMLKIIPTDGLTYPLLNLVGAGIACYASWLISYFPFIILEGAWTIVSLVAVIQKFRLKQT